MRESHRRDRLRWNSLTVKINTQAMNILMILSSPDKTGLTTHTVALSGALVELGHQVTVLTSVNNPMNSEQKYFLEEFRKLGVKVISYECKNGKLSQILLTLKFLKVIRKKWDVIHAQSPYYSFMPWLLRKRFVSTLHVNDLVRCFYYKNATHLIAISNETKEYANRVFGYEDKDMTIVHHGVDMRFAEEWTVEQRVRFKKEHNIPTDKLIVGLVASIEKRKGHDILLEAVWRLPKEIKDKVHIVFVGSSKDGKTNGWLNELVEKYGEGRVSLFPYQDPEVFYKIFDIFVLPSRLEGFGLVVIEAMLTGCCVIRSNVEGAYEQIDNGENGYIFENENIGQLSDVLKDVIEKDSLREKIAKAGKKKALSQFTSKVMAENTIKVYNKIR